MKNRVWAVLVLGILCFSVTQSVAQMSPTSDKGTFSQFALSTSHDSSAGWTTEMDSAVGYDFNRAFTVQAGVPLYLVSASTSTTTGTKQRYNSLGDAFVELYLHPRFDSYSFGLGLVGTAPTGSRKNGISTGRATGTLMGRAQKEVSRFTPFVEATFGNSLAATKRYRRPFTTLGAVSTWTGGSSFDFTDKLSFEASAFDVLPFGDQKIYSHVPGQSSGGGGGSGNSHRPFQQAAVVSGTSSLTKDHGFSGDFSISPVKRVSVDLGYTRSIAYALDTYSGGISLRLGHIQNDKPKK